MNLLIVLGGIAFVTIRWLMTRHTVTESTKYDWVPVFLGLVVFAFVARQFG